MMATLSQQLPESAVMTHISRANVASAMVAWHPRQVLDSLDVVEDPLIVELAIPIAGRHVAGRPCRRLHMLEARLHHEACSRQLQITPVGDSEQQTDWRRREWKI